MPIEPIDPLILKIPDLDPLSPGADEFLGEGDDHMRIVKSATQNTFPVIGESSCTLTAEEINHMYVATGVSMVMWWAESDIVPLPEGWALCDGGVYNGITTPIIASMFLKHGNATEVIGNTGGVKFYDEGLGDHSLNMNEMPHHGHTYEIDTGPEVDDAANSGSDYDQGSPEDQTVEYRGGDEPHSHPFTHDNEPLFFTLQAITYVGVP